MAGTKQLMKTILCAVVLPGLLHYAEANGFLAASKISKTDMMQDLMAELKGNFRDTFHTERLRELEAALAPMFAALPKDAQGKLGHATVRYALHRVMAQQHGWFLKGLEPEAKNSSMDAMKEWTPSYLQAVLDESVGGKGLGLHDLAVLAATLEDLVHRESIGRLQALYELHSKPTSSFVDLAMADELIDQFVLLYHKGGNWSVEKPEEASRRVANWRRHNSAWPRLDAWLRQIRGEVTSKFGTTNREEKNASAVAFSWQSELEAELGFIRKKLPKGLEAKSDLEDLFEVVHALKDRPMDASTGFNPLEELKKVKESMLPQETSAIRKELITELQGLRKQMVPQDVGSALHNQLLEELREIRQVMTLPHDQKAAEAKSSPLRQDLLDELRGLRQEVVTSNASPVRQEALAELKMARDAVTHDFSFEELSRVVEEFGSKYGFHNQGECSGMKSMLVDMEDRDAPGRVLLSKFYEKALYSRWAFTEKIDYLRDLGALDESDPKKPRVIVPNYVASRPQCLEASNFFAVCCPNECEGLMGKLEKEIGRPDALPSDISALVSNLPSDTVQAPRELSESLRSRLEMVANTNGGRVPLHGRLFAQWMHHAFPRECPFPHEAGKASAQTPDEWLQETGQKSHTATEEEMVCHVNGPCSSSSEAASDEATVEMPWSDAEELLTDMYKAPVAASSTMADQLEAVNRILRALLLSGTALGLAAMAKLPELDVKQQAARGAEHLVSLALFASPLLVVTLDCVSGLAVCNDIGIIGGCWALAGMAAVHMRIKEEKYKF